MEYKFKPLGNLQLNFIWIFYICLIIPLDAGCLSVCLKEFDIKYFTTCLILTLLPMLIFIAVRIFYPYKYIITNTHISKTKGKKVLFKIKIEDLKVIVVRKTGLFDYLKFIISLISYYNLSTSNITTISFIFNKYEVLTDYNCGEFRRLPLNNGLYMDCLEYVEIMSYRKAKKIAKYLGIDLHLIKK